VIDMSLSCKSFKIPAIDSTATESKMHGNTNQPAQVGFQKSLRDDGQWLAQVRLKMLRCTAQAMASSPGGLRFVVGTRPWLEGLTGGRQRLAAPGHSG
jgi:hypothetical protein